MGFLSTMSVMEQYFNEPLFYLFLVTHNHIGDITQIFLNVLLHRSTAMTNILRSTKTAPTKAENKKTMQDFALKMFYVNCNQQH